MRILHCIFPGAARHSRHLSANSDAPFIQRLNGNLVPFAHFAQNICLGYAAVFQNQFAGG